MEQDQKEGTITQESAATTEPQSPKKSRLAPTVLALLLCVGLPVLCMMVFLGIAYFSSREESGSGKESPRLAERRMNTCMNNQRQLAVAVMMYVQDNDETFAPSAVAWSNLRPYMDSEMSILVCPSAEYASNGYGFNNTLGSKSLGDIKNPANLLLMADSDAPGNVILSVGDITAIRHGGDRFIAAYVDGHVTKLSSPAGVMLK